MKDSAVRVCAPDGVVAVSLSTPTGPVVVAGPEADVSAAVAAELLALGWRKAKPRPKG